LKQFFRKIIKSRLYLAAIFYICCNGLIHLKRWFKNYVTKSGTTHQAFSLQESMQYIKDVFSDYQKVSGKDRFIGKVAEIGPGDSNGVALMFLAYGASHVDLADRFYSLRDIAQQEQITQKLIAEQPVLKDIYPNLAQCCVRHYGEQACGEKFFDNNNGYNFIISRSVLEHVDDPEIVLKKAYDALSPGGMLINKVDLRDHGMVTPFGYKLKFLEFPKLIYRLMTYGSGFPNRFLFHRYKEVLTKLDPAVKFYVAGLYGVEDNLDQIYAIEEIPNIIKNKAIEFVKVYKNKFAKEFQNVSLDDLIISSFFFVCQKN
jgi:SAM-dependent methyltransferase